MNHSTTGRKQFIRAKPNFATRVHPWQDTILKNNSVLFCNIQPFPPGNPARSSVINGYVAQRWHESSTNVLERKHGWVE